MRSCYLIYYYYYLVPSQTKQLLSFVHNFKTVPFEFADSDCVTMIISAANIWIYIKP